MSIAAYCKAVRNHLRDNLANFYPTVSAKTANCRIMPDETPAANCGQEFVAIYGSAHYPNNTHLQNAIDEKFGITVAVSRKISVIPQQKRGELGYTHTDIHASLPLTDDEDRFYDNWASVEDRCREIVKLLCGPEKYEVMAAANTLLNEGGRYLEYDPDSQEAFVGGPFTEPLQWLRTDPAPRQVGPEHFISSQPLSPDDDMIFGLVMKVYLGDAVRMQPSSDYDVYSEEALP